MKTPAILRAIWLAAGLALVLGFVREPVLRSLPRARLLSSSDAAPNAAWFGGEFRHEGVYPTTIAGLLPPNVPTVGSWVDGDEWQGRAETAWFEATSRIVSVGVVGYPQNAGCNLWRSSAAATEGWPASIARSSIHANSGTSGKSADPATRSR